MAEDRCFKVEPKDNLSAYLEKRELVRDTKEIACGSGLLEKVISNYIVVKNILSHLQWQDQLICKLVCKMWRDAVHALQRELQHPVDFVFEFQEEADSAVLKKSGTLPTEPLAIILFTNFTGFCKMANCSLMSPCPCGTPCGEVHWVIDCADQELCYPKECSLIVRTSYLNYLPLPSSTTYQQTINGDWMVSQPPFVCGMYIPSIPDVQYDVITIKSNSDMQKDFYDIVNKVSETRIFKGLIVFITDKYLLNSVEEIVFLNHFKEVQPDIPFALGGCMVEDSISDRSDLDFFIHNININHSATFISENVITISMFTVPKEATSAKGSNSNFEMFSLIIESSDWTKAKIQKAIKEFSESIPKFEHSVAYKLSCVGRDEKHDYEQDTFRAAFPNTIIVGCYGNGELGLNNPDRPVPKAPVGTVKRHKKDSCYGIMYSYSTVFVYTGWGKVVSQKKTLTVK